MDRFAKTCKLLNIIEVKDMNYENKNLEQDFKFEVHKTIEFKWNG